jgi:sugar lactone lactonase YvrE
MKTLIALVSLTGLAALPACKQKQEEQPAPPLKQPAAVPAPGDAAAPTPGWDGASPHTITEAGFATPESVLYHAEADVYLVSNINGSPFETDGNGFISRVSPDGKVTELKWIDGARDNVQLDAPKGMAISDGILWVADVTVVRQFDAATGESKGEVKVPGASFLNGVTADGAGGVYVTDTGLDDKFAPSGTNAISQISKDGKVRTLISDKALSGPNGIVAGEAGSLWTVTFGSGELIQIDAKGKRGKTEKLPKGQLDGIVALEGGELLVSSWEGEAVYRGTPGGEWKAVIEGVKSPADIGWDSKRRRVLIPGFQTNTVTIHPLD